MNCVRQLMQLLMNWKEGCMNKIEKLIQKHCPNGVIFKQLREIAKISNGKDHKHLNEGKFPVYGSGGIMRYADQFIYTEKSVLIPRKGSIGNIFYVDEPFWTVDTIFYTKIDLALIVPKFLFYYLKTQKLEELNFAGGVPSLTKSILDKIEIPTPPLPIQQEIIKTLDLFTSLEAELEAELEARKKQYQYYRDSLLNFDNINGGGYKWLIVSELSANKLEWKTLGEVGEFIRGKRFVKTDMIASGFPCVHYGEMYTHYRISATEAKSFLDPELAKKLRVAEPGDVIIVAAGETIEDIGNGLAWLGDSGIVIHDACFAFKHSQNPKFVSYFLYTEMFRSQIKKHISSGKISAINAAGLGKALMPVPSLREQERIVAILDKFDALVNDISIGLPAELEARRKQYEYYRNKVLHFKKLEHVTV